MQEEKEKLKALDASCSSLCGQLESLQDLPNGDVRKCSSDVESLSVANEKLKYRVQMLKKYYDELSLEQSLRGSVLTYLKGLFDCAVIDAFPGLQDFECVVTPSTREIFGDYQCNSAMNLSRAMKQQGVNISPMECAKRIIDNIPSDDTVIDSLDIVKPGFVNIRLKLDFLSKRITNLLTEGVKPPPVKKMRIVVDFSSPNVAKEMHVGHLRSTIIGESTCRLLEYLGHDVLRINHIGDWGTQFGMLIAQLQDKFPDYANNCPPIQNLQEFYKESKVSFDNNEEFKKRAYNCVVQLQRYEPNIMKAWKLICDVTRKEIQKIYDCLDVTLIERGESYYQEHMKALVQELQAKNALIKEEGRMLIFTPGLSVPMTIVKSDGGFTYDTSDLAALKQRVEEEKADWIIYIVDVGQALHFETLFAASRNLGICPPSVKLTHAAFGVVLGEDKKKFKTRSGDTIKLADLIQEGLQKSLLKLKEKNRDEVLTPEELKAAQEAVAYGCIKYADLSHDRLHDYIFSFERMLDDKGNSAVYLLYAYMRIRSITRNAKIDENELKAAVTTTPIILDHPKERNLAKVLVRFQDVLMSVMESVMLHTLCDYLYELSVTFSEFYDNCYIIERDDKGNMKNINISRLLLCEASARMMSCCFHIIGLKPVEKL